MSTFYKSALSLVALVIWPFAVLLFVLLCPLFIALALITELLYDKQLKWEFMQVELS